MKKSDLEVPVAPFRGENSITRDDALLFWPISSNWLNDNNNNYLKEESNEQNENEGWISAARRNDADRDGNGSGSSESEPRNENNNANGREEKETSNEPENGFPSSSSSSIIQLSVTKSSVQEPFGIIIQGGTDAPYIGGNGEESTKMRIKEVRPGGAAARQPDLRSGMEVRRVNRVAVQGKTHKEIVSLIQTAGTRLDLDVVIAKPKTPLKSPREENRDAQHDSDEEYADAAANFSENNDAAVSSSRAAPVFNNDAVHENDHHARSVTMATINAAIISSCAADTARQAAANAARVQAASLAIDAKLEELQRLRDDPTSAADLAPTTAASVAFYETTPKQRATGVTASKENAPETSHQPGGPSSHSTPLSNLLWGAVATHVRDPASESFPPAPSNSKSASFSPSSKSKTPSPYRIPTPSPLPPPIENDEDDEAASSHPQRRPRSDTPYPICFPRLPSALDGERGASGGAASTLPPEIDVAQTLKEVVEASPFERPMTAWSINDPTEEAGEEAEGKVRRRSGRRGEVGQRRRLPSDSEASSSDFSTNHSIAADATTFAPGATFNVINPAPTIDPHSEAAECKWRPTSRPVPEIRVTPPRRNRQASSPAPARGAASSSVQAASAEAEAASMRRRGGGGDGVYLLVGSLTLLAASGMVAFYAAKNYKRKA